MDTLTTIIIAPWATDVIFDKKAFTFFLSKFAYDELHKEDATFTFCSLNPGGRQGLVPFCEKVIESLEIGKRRILIALDTKVIPEVVEEIEYYCNDHESELGIAQVIVEEINETERTYIGGFMYDEKNRTEETVEFSFTLMIQQYADFLKKREKIIQN